MYFNLNRNKNNTEYKDFSNTLNLNIFLVKYNIISK